MRFLKLTIVCTGVLVIRVEAQELSNSQSQNSLFLQSAAHWQPGIQDSTSVPAYPDPSQVLYKSLMIPGWGQVVNEQWWKVPIVYALLGGLTGYSIYLTKKYHDYRAAYYNLNSNSPGDEKFGPTPAYIPATSNPSSLRDNRNFLRNRRDFIYITIGLAYGLNAIDAYIFAHLRSFDVSDDLSMRPSLKPTILAQSTPGVTLSLQLFNSSN